MSKGQNTEIFDKLEFWALTVMFILGLLIFFDGNLAETTLYISTFLVLLYVDFRVVPRITRRENVLQSVLGLLAAVGVVVATALLISIFTIYPIGVSDVIVIILLVAGHVAIKQFSLFLISKADAFQAFFVIINRDGLIVLGLWLITDYWMWIVRMPTEIRLAWTFIIPMGILLHALAWYNFLPASLNKRFGLFLYFLKAAVFCGLMGFIVFLLVLVVTGNEDRGTTVGAFGVTINMMFTAPGLLLMYRWQMKGKEQIAALQGELGRSTASVDFLRSQINPHFLFNALNTIYGLAIQEKAERTSTGVEKLGEMMRFMLSENMQDWISLKRELEYLDNYIFLQKLRVDGNPALTISVNVQAEIDPALKVPPMLLIPFVENAFKHGISLREQSYIKIFLELKDSRLYFDVSNSVHRKMENDPEKNSNGIGLENVRQRLQYIYPARHELLVRQTSTDFFIHLSIDLNRFESDRS